MHSVLSIARSFMVAILLLAFLPGIAAIDSEGGEPPIDQDAAVYPNPAQDFVFVQTDRVPFSLTAGDEPSIKVVDILGNAMKVQSEQINSTTYRLDLSQYPSGYYLLVVNCKGCPDASKGFFKFLKQ